VPYTSQGADMVHDAVLGDAQRAHLGALDKSSESLTEARAGLAEHAKKFNEALSLSFSAQGPHLKEACRFRLCVARHEIHGDVGGLAQSKFEYASAERFVSSVKASA